MLLKKTADLSVVFFCFFTMLIIVKIQKYKRLSQLSRPDYEAGTHK